MKTVAIKEHKTGILISPEIISAVVRAIAENFSPRKIVLFGSYAYGHPTPDSDLDLLVIMESDLPWHKRSALIRRIFRPAPCAMDILVYIPRFCKRNSPYIPKGSQVAVRRSLHIEKILHMES
jgi:predicted nucleotidyltransferase